MTAPIKSLTDDDLRQRFVAARNSKGWTQSDLACELGVHWVTISKLERGRIGMSRKWADRLGQALDVAITFSIAPPKNTGLVKPSQRLRTLDESQTDDTQIVGTPCRAADLQEQIEEVLDLLHALDKIGDGIGGADGYAVSAVALAARAALDNARDMLRAMEAGATLVNASRACTCACEEA